MQVAPTPQSLGQRISEARDRASLSRESLAGALGVSLDTIKRWEKGGTVPSYLHVAQIADLTSQPIGWFVSEEAA